MRLDERKRAVVHFSKITAATHPFFDKHDGLIRTIWNTDKNNDSSEVKRRKLTEALASRSPSQLFDIYDEKTGESRARVTPLIIACFEGDYDTIAFLIEVRLLAAHGEK
jgi:hypothetical protein